LSGLVLEEPVVGRFRFAHALVREAIYDDVSRVRLARLHARVAQSLGDGGGAHWWLAAPVVGAGEALPHLVAAADRALAILAHEEAAAHLRHALELLATEPPSAARTRSELDVQLRVSTLYAQLDGARSAAGWEAVTRARDLAEELADGPAMIAAYRTLYEVAVARAEHAEARGLAERMVAVGGAAADQALAHLAVGRTLWCLGEPAAAKEHLIRSLELAAAAPPSPYEALPTEVTVRLQLAPVLDLLGERTAADAHLTAAITRAGAAPQLVRAGVFTSTALIYALRRDVPAAGEHARRALELAGPLPAWFSYASAVGAWARALAGDPAGGARVLRVSLDEIRSRGARHLVGWVLGLLAEAEALAGDAGEGLRLLDEARELVARTGERMYEAELDRLRGELVRNAAHT
jgi:tetratricopeptide (TPR) repeat protein